VLVPTGKLPKSTTGMAAAAAMLQKTPKNNTAHATRPRRVAKGIHIRSASVTTAAL
jgi:hypothetical protein